jgi:hypothetical protein
LDYKGTFELRRYAMPSWKLEAKRVLPGKLPDETYIIPSTDGKAVVVVSLSDDNSHVVSRHAYEAGGILKAVPISSVKFADLPTDADVEALYHGPYRAELTPFLDWKGKEVLRLRRDAVPGVAIFELGAQKPVPLGIVFGGNHLTIIHRETRPWFRHHLAETGDAILAQYKNPDTNPKNQSPDGRLSVYSAATGKEVTSMTVPVLANKDASCIALWHDQVAVFTIPGAFVVVNFAKQNFKVVPNEDKLDGPRDIHPLWVEAETK